jgi:hypothetical protein
MSSRINDPQKTILTILGIHGFVIFDDDENKSFHVVGMSVNRLFPYAYHNCIQTPPDGFALEQRSAGKLFIDRPSHRRASNPPATAPPSQMARRTNH